MNDIITVIANVSLALSFVVALVFGIFQVRAAARDRRETFALEWLRNFQTREFAELMHHVISHKAPLTQKEFQTLPAHDQVMFIQFSQQMEMLGLVVAAKLVDIEFVDVTLGSFVMTSWAKYKTMFLDMRETTSDPYLAEYFQSLAEEIDEHLKEHQRKPFYKKS